MDHLLDSNVIALMSIIIIHNTIDNKFVHIAWLLMWLANLYKHNNYACTKRTYNGRTEGGKDLKESVDVHVSKSILLFNMGSFSE